MIGKEIAGRYQIEAELGAGGMGTVFQGIDTHTDETVAIKQLKPDMAQPNVIERFQREGVALRELNHPNMVKLLDMVEENGNHYLILDYVSGGDLKQLLEKGEMPVEQILMIAIQIADALTRAHFLNIIHRDLKPANILLAEDGTALLTDFGVARVVSKERITHSDAIVGTIDYIAPEVFGDKGIDSRVDIWAFGVMLFEMLTANVPFKGKTYIEKMFNITHEAVPDLEALRPDAPIDLVDLVYRMLEKDPYARMASVRYVGAALEDMLQGRSTHTPPESRFATPIPQIFERPKHNLPSQTTEFVGREAELSQIARLLDDSKIRLLSIVAAGGMGKTRLALAAAETHIDNYKHGVFFVELAPLSDPKTIIPAIANATGYQFQSDGREQKQQILDFLANKSMLLVMDNFEHLLDAASLMTDILNAAPDVQILATSRQRLNQSGETVFNLEGMDFPEWETPEDALEYAAVKLFMQSAKRVQPQFELTLDNMDYIARICILVQGMPLGILLAATWLAMLSVKEIAEEIAKGIDFLASDMGDLPERHRSIRAVFDHSWNMMSEDERAVFMKLSVFRGGFTREAAQDIAGANLRILMNLVNKSLIRRDAETGRYDIHELLRQYAEEQLEISGSSDDIRDTHSNLFLNMLHGLEKHLDDGRQLDAAQVITADFDNIYAAWYRAVQQHDIALIKNAIYPLSRYGWMRVYDVPTIIDMYQFALESIESERHLEDIRVCYAYLLVAIADVGEPVGYNLQEAMQLAQEGLGILRDVDDAFGIAYACGTLGWWYLALDDDPVTADQLIEEAFSRYSELGNIVRTGEMLTRQANIWDFIGKNLYEIIQLNQQAGELILQSGNQMILALNYGFRGHYLWKIGEYDQAEKLTKEAMSLARKGMFQTYQHNSLGTLANIAQIHGDYQKARQLRQEILELTTYTNNRRAQSRILVSLANIASIEGKHEQALALRDEALEIFPTMKNAQIALIDYRRGAFRQGIQILESIINEIYKETVPTFNPRTWLYMGLLKIKVNRIEEAQQALYRGLANAFGRNWLSPYFYTGIYGFAEIFSRTGQAERAVELAALVYEHPKAVHEYRVYAANLLEKLKAELDEDAFSAAYERGKSLDLEATVQALVDEFGDGE